MADLRTYKVDMKPVAGWIAIGQHPGALIFAKVALKLIDLELRLDNNLREPLHAETLRTPHKPAPGKVGRIPHMIMRAPRIKLLAVPAARQRNRDPKP